MGQERIFHMFDERFAQHKEVPMALYGLGINTKYLLEETKDYNIIGVVANDRIGEYVYGKEVLPVEAVEDKVKIIVIVAQMKSVKIIYNRIKHIEDKGIDIYDIYGRKIKSYFDDENSKWKDEPYWDSTFDKLKAEIDKHDIISFEVFDTLIMRKVLSPDRIWDNTAAYDMEEKYVIKRRCMVEAFEYARLQGKDIYFLSDTYLTSEQIHGLLSECSREDIDIGHVLTSSDTKKAKSDGSLYEYFNNLVGKGSKLHVGSNIESDVEIAAQFGIDTFYIMSAYEMLLKSSVGDIIEYAANVCDYTVLGLFAAKAFNNPFALSESKGLLKIDNMYELGYYCFAPITIKFLAWIVEKLGSANNSVILFSSRDGYLLYKLYQYLKGKKPQLKLPEGIYFYISRRAATVACIQTEADIIDIIESVLRLSIGNLGEILEQRLGVAFDKGDGVLDRSLMDVLGEKDSNRIIERVLEYKDKILENAALERRNYLKYIHKSALQDYDKIYLFDLYTKGTSVNKLGKLLNTEAELLCYAVKDFPNEYISAMDNVESMFDNTDIMSGEWFKRSYQLFEAVYSSPEGQLKCFDNDGMPQFVENSGYNYSYIKEAQEGIIAFINDLEALDDKWHKHNFNLDMMDYISRMMAEKKSVASVEIRSGFTYHDSFASDERMNIWDRII